MNSLYHISLFLLQYGVIQALLLALWLFFKRKQTVFALFFLNIAYLIFIFVYEVSGWTEAFPHFIWTNVPSWFLIAPLLFLYAKQSLGRTKSFRIIDGLHFLPTIITLILFIPFYLSDGENKLAIYHSFYGEDFDVDYVQLIYISQMAAYAYWGRKYIARRLNRITQSSSDSNIVFVFVIPKIFSILYLYTGISIINALIYGLIENSSSLYYAIAFLVLSSTTIAATFYLLNAAEDDLPQNFNVDRIPEVAESNSYKTSPLSDSDLDTISTRVVQVIEEKELFRNPNLNLNGLAKACDIPAHHISQCLNQRLNQSFFDFVNGYRMNAVKKALQANQQASMTLLAIAQDCGFKSQSSFYRITKSETGMTPGQLAKSIEKDFPT